MSDAPARHAARLRGTAAGFLTGTLALAAHGVGSGALPTGAAAPELLILAATAGALAAAIPRAADAHVMLGLLCAGQLVGHLMLAAAGHSHGPSHAPAAWMMALAHLGAVAIGAVLISLGDRLCRAVSRVLARPGRCAALPAAPPAIVAITSADQPLRWTLFLAASMSHRGPPVSLAR